jgi:hypothetical protein
MIAVCSSWRPSGTKLHTAPVLVCAVSWRDHLCAYRPALGAAGCHCLAALRRKDPSSRRAAASALLRSLRSNITPALGAQRQPSAAEAAVPGPPDDSTLQHTTRQHTSSAQPDSASIRNQAARLQELQQAIELELGARHRLQPQQLTRGLGAALAARPEPILRERVRALAAAIGAEPAAALLRSYPRLVVHVRPSEVAPRLDAWAAAFGTDRARIVRLCSRVGSAGFVLQCRPDDARAKVGALCRVLQLGPAQLLELCAKYTRVLMVAPGDVLGRAAALGQGLRLDAAGVAELCCVRPACLASPSSSVMEAVEAVRVALGVPREEAVEVCVGCPSLLGKSATSILAKARALKQHLGLEGRDLVKCMVRRRLPFDAACATAARHSQCTLLPPAVRHSDLANAGAR